MIEFRENPNEATIIVDYGLGNLLSIQEALKFMGIEAHVSSKPSDLHGARRIVLPGVGSFSQASKLLHDGGFAQAVIEAAVEGIPVLGICLGMQVLFDVGLENERSPGLGLISGSVERIVESNDENWPQTHIGWRRLESSSAATRPEASLIVDNGPYYFVHSYGALPTNFSAIRATVTYGSKKIPAIVQEKNIVGVQFHPEKSRAPGLELLAQFCQLGHQAGELQIQVPE